MVVRSSRHLRLPQQLHQQQQPPPTNSLPAPLSTQRSLANETQTIETLISKTKHMARCRQAVGDN